jgi:hypothetical protein
LEDTFEITKCNALIKQMENLKRNYTGNEEHSERRVLMILTQPYNQQRPSTHL